MFEEDVAGCGPTALLFAFPCASFLLPGTLLYGDPGRVIILANALAAPMSIFQALFGVALALLLAFPIVGGFTSAAVAAASSVSALLPTVLGVDGGPGTRMFFSSPPILLALLTLGVVGEVAGGVIAAGAFDCLRRVSSESESASSLSSFSAFSCVAAAASFGAALLPAAADPAVDVDGGVSVLMRFSFSSSSSGAGEGVSDPTTAAVAVVGVTACFSRMRGWVPALLPEEVSSSALLFLLLLGVAGSDDPAVAASFGAALLPAAAAAAFGSLRRVISESERSASSCFSCVGVCGGR